MALTLLFPAIALALLSIGLVDEALRMPFHVGVWSVLWALCAIAGAVALGVIAAGRLA